MAGPLLCDDFAAFLAKDPAVLRQGWFISKVAGTVAADTLHLGNITVKNQGFGLVLSSSSDFLDISCDGLFVSPLPLSCVWQQR